MNFLKSDAKVYLFWSSTCLLVIGINQRAGYNVITKKLSWSKNLKINKGNFGV